MRRAKAACWLVVVALVATSCISDAGSEGDPSSDQDAGASVMVQPDYEADEFVVNVLLTDQGIEPATIFIPAGPSIRLILRNRGTSEHHFRIAGLIPQHMSWLRPPDVSGFDIDSMTPEQLAELGIENSSEDVEHVLHHLAPSFVPFKGESPAGIKPLPTEVHGYALLGVSELMSFFAVNTGVFEARDVLYPEFTARVIVFDANQ
jgi:hypothetical protein